MSPPYRRPALAIVALALAACPALTSRHEAASANRARGGDPFVVESHLWRNFQPRADRPDTSLAALIRLRHRDRTPLPVGVRVERAVLRLGRERWIAVPREESPPWSPDVLEVVARGGPAWAPGSAVDVTIELRDGRGRAQRLVLKGQRIRRLD